jgi:hypothetical protein
MSDQQQYSPSGTPLPQPNFIMGQPGPVQAPQAFHAPEVNPIQISPMGQAPQTMPLPQPMAPQQPPAFMAPPAQPTQQYSAAGATAVASPEEDDSQLDEVWINKAREIVEKTQYDPYLQSSELSKVKAGYLKSRYNKDIKIIEDRLQ